MQSTNQGIYLCLHVSSLNNIGKLGIDCNGRGARTPIMHEKKRRGEVVDFNKASCMATMSSSCWYMMVNGRKDYAQPRELDGKPMKVSLTPRGYKHDDHIFNSKQIKETL